MVREGEADDRAGPFARLGPDRSAVAFDDPPRHDKAHAGWVVDGIADRVRKHRHRLIPGRRLAVVVKELVGDEYTGKDLRTWHGTVLAAAAFVDADPPANNTAIKRVESAVMKEVAEELGNTPAVARSSYVDPRVVEGYESGLTIAAGARRANRTKMPGERQAILENSTARLIRKVAKG